MLVENGDLDSDLDLDSDFDVEVEKFKAFCCKNGMEYKSHQVDGLRWCLKRENFVNYQSDICGGIIADEMGLGKTILMIGTMVTNMKKKTLIVLPPILIDQWYNEIHRTTGHKALVYHGSKKKKITLEHFKKMPVIIISYNTLISNKDDVDSLFYRVVWDRVIFDEAHHLRNQKTEIHKKVLSLKSKIMWLVSGTPVQNKKNEFYNLCKILKIPKEYYKVPSNSVHFILRRTKKDVGIVISDLTIHEENVPWKNKAEEGLAYELHSVLYPDVLERGIAGGNFVNTFKINYETDLPLYTKAKQFCVYPNMLVKSLDFLVRNGALKNYSHYEEALKGDTKLEAVINIVLKNRENGKGKIVFCQFREEMDFLEKGLMERGISSVARIDGRVSKKKRETIIHGDSLVLLLQIQCGCEGLNLQNKYSEIYFVSPHWNQAIEEQAIARCHRIGQKNPVHIYRFNMTSVKDSRDSDLDNVIEDGGLLNFDSVNHDLVDQDLESMDIYIRKNQEKKMKNIITVFKY